MLHENDLSLKQQKNKANNIVLCPEGQNFNQICVKSER